MIKISKIIFINILVFILSLILIEMIFGGWFSKDSFGAYFREHRMKKVNYSIKYDEEIYKYTYLRNYHGFKGEEIEPSQIEAVFIGGSTADERWKPEKFSIVELLNSKFKKDNLEFKIINSAIEGQSTTGYIANFKFWYKSIPNFKPKYFIFYTGINELLKQNYDTFDYSDGMAKLVAKNAKERRYDELKSKSFFYDSARKIKHKYYSRDKIHFMDLDKSIQNRKNNKSSSLELFNNKINSYVKFNSKFAINKLQESINDEKKFIKSYIKNIDILKSHVDDYSAKAIFINQVTAYGANVKRHLALNKALNDHCKKNNYICIDIASNFNGEFEFWYDEVHTTPLGSKKISEVIYPKLKKIVNR